LSFERGALAFGIRIIRKIAAGAAFQHAKLIGHLRSQSKPAAATRAGTEEICPDVVNEA